MRTTLNEGLVISFKKVSLASEQQLHNRKLWGVFVSAFPYLVFTAHGTIKVGDDLSIISAGKTKFALRGRQRS